MSQPEETDPAEVEEIIRRRNNAFDQVELDDVVIYTAYTEEDRSVQSLAQQTGRDQENIRRSINYVRSALETELSDYRGNT